MKKEDDLPRVSPPVVALDRQDLPRSPLPDGSPRWQPIETAPKDGTRILVAWPNEAVQEAYFSRRSQRWNDQVSDAPTHWMPLPQAPTGTVVTPDADIQSRVGELLAALKASVAYAGLNTVDPRAPTDRQLAEWHKAIANAERSNP